MNRFSWAVVTILLTGLILTPSIASAQSAISGLVSDTSGAVLPGVEITIINIDTDFERTFTTDEHGDYTVPLLPPGTYRVRAELSGFRSEIVEDLEAPLAHFATTAADLRR